MGLLDSVIGAAANSMLGQRQGGGGITGNPMIDLVLGMLTQGGGQQGGGLGGLGGLLGGALGGGQASAQGGGMGGGLGGLIQMAQQFQQAGMGDQIQSWISTGQNLPISPEQLQQVFGQGTIGDIASQLGMSPSDASGQLAQVLPELIDKLTPNGQIPDSLEGLSGLAQGGGLDTLLGGLNSVLGARR